MFPSNIFGLLSFEKNEKGFITLNQEDLSKIENFIDSKTSSDKWGWFVEMLCVMIETGLRTEELCKIELKNISIEEHIIEVLSLDKKHLKFQISNRNWTLIKRLIINETTT